MNTTAGAGGVIPPLSTDRPAGPRQDASLLCRVSDVLFGVAIGEGLIRYGSLARHTGIQPEQVGPVLEQVSRRAVERGEPLWSALAVVKETGRPEDTFYVLARSLRPEYSAMDNGTLWRAECQRCYLTAWQA